MGPQARTSLTSGVLLPETCLLHCGVIADACSVESEDRIVIEGKKGAKDGEVSLPEDTGHRGLTARAQTMGGP